MERKNNLPNGDIMARKQKCPICGLTAYCISTITEVDILTKRYFTCSNQPNCGAQFVMSESLSHYVYKPDTSSVIENIRSLLSSISDKDKKELMNELREKDQAQIAMTFIESLPMDQQKTVIDNFKK